MILSYLKLGIWSLIQKNIKPLLYRANYENDRIYNLAGNSIFLHREICYEIVFLLRLEVTSWGKQTNTSRFPSSIPFRDTHKWKGFLFILFSPCDTWFQLCFMICNLCLKHSCLWLHFRLLMLNFTNRRRKANNFGSYTEKSHCGSHHRHSKGHSFRKLTWYQCNVKLERLPISSLALLCT